MTEVFLLGTFHFMEQDRDVFSENMQREISESALTATKSYSAGTSNLYASPLLGEYNRTCASADRACALLSKLIETARKRADAFDEDDEL